MTYWILKTPTEKSFAFYYTEGEQITTPPKDELVAKLNGPATPQILESIVTQLNEGVPIKKVIEDLKAYSMERASIKTHGVRAGQVV